MNGRCATAERSGQTGRMDDVAGFVEALMRADRGRWRLTVEDQRQEAWVVALEHGCDAEAVRRAWRKASRAKRLPTATAFDGDGNRSAWDFDSEPDRATLPYRPELPTGVDPTSLALVEAVMLDGADFDDARAGLGLSRAAAERVMRAAGVTVTGRRFEAAGLGHLPVEGLLAYQQRCEDEAKAKADRFQLTFDVVAREMGVSSSLAGALANRWEALGAIDLGRTATGRRTYDWVNVAGLMVLGRAHTPTVARYNQATRSDGMPANWPQLREAIEGTVKQVRFRPGVNEWRTGWSGSQSTTRIPLLDIRNRARALTSGDPPPLVCACGCGRRLSSTNRTGYAQVCIRQMPSTRRPSVTGKVAS